MEIGCPKDDRRVLPRWRSIERTSAVELSGQPLGKPLVVVNGDRLDSAYEIWRVSPTIENAFEVVNASIVTQNDTPLAVGAARQILTSGIPQFSPLRRIAGRVVHGHLFDEEKQQANSRPLNDLDLLRGETSKGIREAKERVKRFPRSSIGYCELSRNYAIGSEREKAIKAMNIALSLAPENRYIVRCAARLFSHYGDFEKAHWAAYNSPAIRHDPWIQAAEISTSSLAGKPARFLKVGSLSLDDKSIISSQKSELASAVATEYLRAGDNRRSKRTFMVSLRNPTENAVAQAMWAHNYLDINIDTRLFSINNAFEAQVWKSIEAVDLHSALMNAHLWLMDETFSVNPAVVASFIASNFFDDHKLALSYVNRSLFSNTGDIRLINNLVYHSLMIGDVVLAERYIDRIMRYSLDDPSAAAPIATVGLYNFKKGNVDGGREYYKKSIRFAMEKKNWDAVVLARMHWLDREIDLGSINGESLGKAIAEIESCLIKNQKSIHGLTKLTWRNRGYVNSDMLPFIEGQDCFEYFDIKID